MRVTFNMLGEDQFARELLRIGKRAGNMRPVFGLIAGKWTRWTREQFDSEGRRASGGWAALAPSTVARRGSAHPILQDSGALVRELTDEGNIDITDDYMHMTIPDDVDEYGRLHQSGTSKMPQRRPLEFTDVDKREMVRDLQRWTMFGELSSL